MLPKPDIGFHAILSLLSADSERVRAFFRFALNSPLSLNDGRITYREAVWVAMSEVLFKLLSGNTARVYSVASAIAEPLWNYLNNPLAESGFTVMIIDSQFVVVTGWNKVYDFVAGRWVDGGMPEPVCSIAISLPGIEAKLAAINS